MSQHNEHFLLACQHGNLAQVLNRVTENRISSEYAKEGLFCSIENGHFETLPLLFKYFKQHYTTKVMCKALYRLDSDRNGFLILKKQTLNMLRVLLACCIPFRVEKFPAFYHYDNVFTLLAYFNSETCIPFCDRYKKEKIFKKRQRRIHMGMVKYDVAQLVFGLRRLDLPRLLLFELAHLVAEPFSSFVSLYELSCIINPF